MRQEEATLEEAELEQKSLEAKRNALNDERKELWRAENEAENAIGKIHGNRQKAEKKVRHCVHLLVRPHVSGTALPGCNLGIWHQFWQSVHPHRRMREEALDSTREQGAESDADPCNAGRGCWTLVNGNYVKSVRLCRVLHRPDCGAAPQFLSDE